jgi:hypothetical protein
MVRRVASSTSTMAARPRAMSVVVARTARRTKASKSSSGQAMTTTAAAASAQSSTPGLSGYPFPGRSGRSSDPGPPAGVVGTRRRVQGR